MKKRIDGKCVICNQPVHTDQVGVGYTKTKRKGYILFHECCYYGCTLGKLATTFKQDDN